MVFFERAKNVLHQTMKRMLIYVLRTRNNTIYGHDPFLDIVRLSRAMNYTDSTIIDVGANSGQTTLRFVREFPTSKIYSFEPHPGTFAKLQQNVRKHNNVIPINAALGRTNGVTDLYVYENSALNSVLADSPFISRFGVPGTCISVNLTCLDDFCSSNGIKSLHVLKIDTEGFDIEVLKGATRLMDRGKIKFIYIEFNDLFEIPNATGGSLIAIGEFLKNWGYRFVASYTDYVEPVGKFFISCNALFILAP